MNRHKQQTRRKTKTESKPKTRKNHENYTISNQLKQSSAFDCLQRKACSDEAANSFDRHSRLWLAVDATSRERDCTRTRDAGSYSRRPGQTAASIQSTVDAFRAALGGSNNGNNPGPLLSGRREINWDGGNPAIWTRQPR